MLKTIFEPWKKVCSITGGKSEKILHFLTNFLARKLIISNIIRWTSLNTIRKIILKPLVYEKGMLTITLRDARRWIDSAVSFGVPSLTFARLGITCPCQKKRNRRRQASYRISFRVYLRRLRVSPSRRSATISAVRNNGVPRIDVAVSSGLRLFFGTLCRGWC